jgi:hypothetical protein
VHEVWDSSPVELSVPRVVPAGVQSASATEDFCIRLKDMVVRDDGRVLITSSR